MTRHWRGKRWAIAALVAALIPCTALAQDAGELVQLVQENLVDIELEMRLDPDSAEENLARQRDRLATLRNEEPDHPMLSSLERRINELDAEIAAAREAQPEAVSGEEQFVPLSVPADVRIQLRKIKQLQTSSDREMMRGRMDIAAQHLDESEGLIATIEDEYGDQIPPGYAALIIAKERLDALRDQLGRQQAN